MSGYHSVSVIADAILKGNAKNIDANKAPDACIATARHRSYDGIGLYIDKGYIPIDRNGIIVSTTLEYAYEGSLDYAIGSPAVNGAVLKLENGKTFTIEVKDQSEKNVYVKKIQLNGKVFIDFTLQHEDIMNGGKLISWMSDIKPL